MIDYEKLRWAHELANKLNERISINVCYLVADNKPTFVLDHSDFKNNITSYNIDDLIAKLRELTQPKPKYIEGWVIDGFGKMDYWTHMNEEDIKEKDIIVYPSKEALIDAQIEYWNKENCAAGRHMDCEGDYECVWCGIEIEDDAMIPPFEGDVLGFNSCTTCKKQMADVPDQCKCPDKLIKSNNHPEVVLEMVCKHESNGIRYARRFVDASDINEQQYEFKCVRCEEYFL